MKLEAKKLADLTAVLNAQTELKTNGKTTMDKDAYKAAIASVGDLLKKGPDGKTVGGVTAEVYKANPEIQAAAKAHADAAKLPKPEKAAKAAPAKAAPAKEAPKSKERTPEMEAATGAAYVKYVGAIVEKAKSGKDTLSKKEFAEVELATRKYRDPQKGGLKNTAPEGKDTPWARFSGLPGVKEAAKAHQAHVKAKSKDAPTM